MGLLFCDLALIVKDSVLGKNVTVFLLDEAVYLARKGAAKNLRAATAAELIDLACKSATISL